MSEPFFPIDQSQSPSSQSPMYRNSTSIHWEHLSDSTQSAHETWTTEWPTMKSTWHPLDEPPTEPIPETAFSPHPMPFQDHTTKAEPTMNRPYRPLQAMPKRMNIAWSMKCAVHPHIFDLEESQHQPNRTSTKAPNLDGPTNVPPAPMAEWQSAISTGSTDPYCFEHHEQSCIEFFQQHYGAPTSAINCSNAAFRIVLSFGYPFGTWKVQLSFW